MLQQKYSCNFEVDYQQFTMNRLPAMKRFISIVFLLGVLPNVVFAQVPQGFNYQAVVRDSSGEPNVNADGLKVDFVITNANSENYTETHSPVSTNAFGLINLVVGQGATSDNFDLFDWSKLPVTIEILVDDNSIGSSTLLSSPYALNAGASHGVLD